ncbi:MAG: phenylalanine--tRNA ligase subunit beta [candidate division Zixibacteria bacterium 4484_95]|nr:MAG: phenylalanine--tRNA ligase subunit beta [candidate division Zixibacteria bacterium 4484_95]
MKISYNWLKELLDFDASPEEVAYLLTMSGSEVETIENKGFEIKGVVTATITDIKPHPNANKLTICDVDTGEGKVSVVCGAPNLKIGMKVFFAGEGAVLAGNNKLKKATIRGVESSGMILAEDELGISDDHTIVIELADGYKPGRPIEDILALNDYIFELEITPNRPDCLSHIGIARELKALLGGKLKFPETSIDETGPEVSSNLTIEIDDPDGCPRYTGRLISDVKVRPSPLWLKLRLYYLGLRPINNIVDITNYVLLETGHPLHAFDYDYFKTAKVQVRRAYEGEKFVTLDEVERILNSKHLLITNAEEPVALAGIMGGLHSEVTESTTRVLLESAYFDPVTIRYGAKTVGLSTESSQRFERGADPDMAPKANNRACKLIAELANGKVFKGIVDAYPKNISPVKISFRPQIARTVLGIDINSNEINKIFKGLDIEFEGDGSLMDVTQPSFRPDLTREIDLVEEIARIYGLDKIPEVYRAGGTLGAEITPKAKVIDRLRNFLVGRGFVEIFPLTLVDGRQLIKIDNEIDFVKLQNPISEEMSALRPDLATTMLKVLRHNINHGNKDIKLFEVGTYYKPVKNGLALEKELICLAISGREEPVSWRHKEVFSDFYSIKAEIEAIFEYFKISDFEIEPCNSSHFADDCSYMIKDNDKIWGRLGRISSDVAKIVGIKQESFLAELEFDIFCEYALRQSYFKPLPRFPASNRDIAIIVDQSIPAKEIISLIKKVAGDIVEDVFPFDLYKGKNVSEGMKGIAFRIIYRSKDHTLTDDEVEEVHGRISQRLNKELGAQLRSK